MLRQSTPRHYQTGARSNWFFACWDRVLPITRAIAAWLQSHFSVTTQGMSARPTAMLATPNAHRRSCSCNRPVRLGPRSFYLCFASWNVIKIERLYANKIFYSRECVSFMFLCLCISIFLRNDISSYCQKTFIKSEMSHRRPPEESNYTAIRLQRSNTCLVGVFIFWVWLVGPCTTVKPSSWDINFENL
jgi:hypothetical protein